MTNAEKCRLYKKRHPRRVKKQNKAYRAAHPEVYKRAHDRYRLDPKNRLKILARNKVTAALTSGRLKRQSCKKCGKKKTTAHHPDYRRPLYVVWLCVMCHKNEHKKGGKKSEK